MGLLEETIEIKGKKYFKPEIYINYKCAKCGKIYAKYDYINGRIKDHLWIHNCPEAEEDEKVVCNLVSVSYHVLDAIDGVILAQSGNGENTILTDKEDIESIRSIKLK